MSEDDVIAIGKDLYNQNSKTISLSQSPGAIRTRRYRKRKLSKQTIDDRKRNLSVKAAIERNRINNLSEENRCRYHIRASEKQRRYRERKKQEKYTSLLPIPGITIAKTKSIRRRVRAAILRVKRQVEKEKRQNKNRYIKPVPKLWELPADIIIHVLSFVTNYIPSTICYLVNKITMCCHDSYRTMTTRNDVCEIIIAMDKQKHSCFKTSKKLNGKLHVKKSIRVQANYWIKLKKKYLQLTFETDEMLCEIFELGNNKNDKIFIKKIEKILKMHSYSVDICGSHIAAVCYTEGVSESAIICCIDKIVNKYNLSKETINRTMTKSIFQKEPMHPLWISCTRGMPILTAHLIKIGCLNTKSLFSGTFKSRDQSTNILVPPSTPLMAAKFVRDEEIRNKVEEEILFQWEQCIELLSNYHIND